MLILFLYLQQFILANFPDVKYVWLWNSDVDFLNDGKGQPQDEPVIYIEFPDNIKWDQLGNGCQIVDPLSIKFHIVGNELDATDGSMSQNLDALKMAEDLFLILQDNMPTTLTIAEGGMYDKYAGTYTVPLGAMVRSGEVQDKKHSNLYHFIQEYMTTYVDSATNRPRNGKLSVPVLNLEVVTIPSVPGDQQEENAIAYYMN